MQLLERLHDSHRRLEDWRACNATIENTRRRLAALPPPAPAFWDVARNFEPGRILDARRRHDLLAQLRVHLASRQEMAKAVQQLLFSVEHSASYLARAQLSDAERHNALDVDQALDSVLTTWRQLLARRGGKRIRRPFFS
jgi:hypothetical protein